MSPFSGDSKTTFGGNTPPRMRQALLRSWVHVMSSGETCRPPLSQRERSACERALGLGADQGAGAPQEPAGPGGSEDQPMRAVGGTQSPPGFGRPPPVFCCVFFCVFFFFCLGGGGRAGRILRNLFSLFCFFFFFFVFPFF